EAESLQADMEVVAANGDQPEEGGATHRDEVALQRGAAAPGDSQLGGVAVVERRPDVRHAGREPAVEARGLELDHGLGGVAADAEPGGTPVHAAAAPAGAALAAGGGVADRVEEGERDGAARGTGARAGAGAMDHGGDAEPGEREVPAERGQPPIAQ